MKRFPEDMWSQPLWIGTADKRNSGSADQRTSGPAHQRISRPADQRISGSADQRISGSADQRTSGSADQRTSGSADQRISGPADPRIRGSADQRTSGAAEQRSSGPADQRISGSADQWTSGSADQRIRQPSGHKSFLTYSVHTQRNQTQHATFIVGSLDDPFGAAKRQVAAIFVPLALIVGIFAQSWGFHAIEVVFMCPHCRPVRFGCSLQAVVLWGEVQLEESVGGCFLLHLCVGSRWFQKRSDFDRLWNLMRNSWHPPKSAGYVFFTGFPMTSWYFIYNLIQVPFSKGVHVIEID